MRVFFLLLALVIQALGAGIALRCVPFPSALDEDQHVAAIRWMQARPSLLPRYERAPPIPADLVLNEDATNYNPHPSPFYLLMAGVADIAGSPISLRLASALIGMTGVGLLLAAGWRALPDDHAFAVFALVTVLFPKLGVIGGVVNNDAFGLVATGLFLLGLVRWHEKGSDWLLPLALGFAGWTKLTVFLMLGIAFGIYEIITGLRWRKPYVWAATGVLVGAIPTLVNFARYGRTLYTTGARVHAAPQHWTLGRYAEHFFARLGEKWSATEPTILLAYVGLVSVLILGAASVRRDRPVSSALILALVPTLAIHFWFGWQAMLQSGFVDMAQPRYYYAVWPGFAVGLAAVWRESSGLLRTAVTTLTGIGLFAASTVFCLSAALVAGVPLS